MAIYNITGFQESKTIVDIAVWGNNIVDQTLFGSIIIGMFFIFFLSFKIKFDFIESILGSSFLCFILSLFLRQAGLINFMFVIGFLIIVALSTMLLFITKK